MINFFAESGRYFISSCFQVGTVLAAGQYFFPISITMVYADRMERQELEQNHNFQPQLPSASGEPLIYVTKSDIWPHQFYANFLFTSCDEQIFPQPVPWFFIHVKFTCTILTYEKVYLTTTRFLFLLYLTFCHPLINSLALSSSHSSAHHFNNYHLSALPRFQVPN